MLRGAGPLLGAAHIEPSLAVTLAATALAWGAGLGGRAALVALAVGAGQLSIGWSNDWLDRRRDQAAGRADKPLAQGRVSAPAVATAAGVALAVCVGASLALGPAAAAVHLLAVAAGWVYNLRAKRTWWSVLPWALAFGLLPAVVTLATPLERWPAWWLLTAGALLGAGAHFANAIPDLPDDRATGVAGLPHRLGRRWSVAVTIALVAIGLALVTLGLPAGPPRAAVGGAGAFGLVAVVLALRAGAERLAFRLVVVLLVALAAAVVAAGATLR